MQTKLRIFLKWLAIDVCGIEDWPAEKGNEELDEILSLLMCRCCHLTSFTLRAHGQFDPAQPLAPRHHHYLSMWSPARLLDALWASKLLELEIDTCGSELKNEIHVCPQLALKIPSLRSVRLRMHKICPQIFDLQHEEGARSSKIESIIINLSLKETDCLSAGYRSHCTGSRRAWALFDDMVMTANEMLSKT